MFLNIRCLFPTFCMVLFALGCKKEPQAPPAAPPPTSVPPSASDTSRRAPLHHTAKIPGTYIWHGTKKKLGQTENVFEVYTIKMGNDSSVYYHDLNTWKPEYYYASSFNDSELIFTKADITDSLIFNYKVNRLIRRTVYPEYITGEIVRRVLFTAVPQQNEKWRAIWMPKMSESRKWRYRNHYYTSPEEGADTVIDMEVTGTALSFGGPQLADNFFHAADSTHMLYREVYYDYGPSTYSTIGTMSYSVSSNSIYISHREPYQFGASYSYQTID